MGLPKSLVLVTVDCLRADHVGFMGYQRPTTPFLDSLAHDSLIVPAAIVAGAPTYYSLPAILGARTPLALGRDVLGIAPQETTLASTLKHAGYATAAFIAGNPYISGRFGYDQGFDTFHDFLDDDPAPVLASEKSFVGNQSRASRLNQKLQGLSEKIAPLAAAYHELYFRYCQLRATPPSSSLDELRRFPAANVLVDHACSWLAATGGGPFFLWLHLMDPHAPYFPTQKALELMGKEGCTPSRARYLNSFWHRHDLGPRRLAKHRDEVVALYDAGIRWVDEQMARLIARLKDDGHWNNCIVALTADHGEEFLDHGGRFHPPSRLLDELIRVPLLLRVPGTTGKKSSGAPFSLVHLAPTLLESAQLPAQPAFRGQSYWPELQSGASWNEPAISECIAGCTNPFRPEDRAGPRILAVREARYKLILHFDPVAEDLYDLEADPQEIAPLPPGAEKAVRRRLLEAARAHLAGSARPDLEPRLRALLKELRLEWAKTAQPPEAVRF
jgi:arylsulfatase A-like enzyme